MIKYLLSFTLLAFGAQALASQNSSFSTELCAIEYAQTYHETFTEISATEIFEYKTVSNELLAVINNHLMTLEYTNKPLSLPEIQALFSQDGEFYYDGMTITELVSKKTGIAYLQTMSWPGENPYSFNYDAKTFELRAIGQDDSITLVDGNQSAICPSVK